MDRSTHTIIAWAVVPERDEVRLQAVVDQAPQAHAYYSDGFAAYQQLVYGPASYTAMQNKSQTYSVEGGNAQGLRVTPVKGF